MAVLSRIRSAWNAFVNTDPPAVVEPAAGPVTYSAAPPSKPRRRYSNERTIVSSIFARISIDVAAVSFRHARVDATGRYKENIDSNFNMCLNLEANLDQAPRQFRQDIVLTLFDKGVAAIVPVDTTVDPDTNEIFDIYSLRVGEVTAWYPRHVRVNVYNEKKGVREEITLEKRFVAIVENPLYTVMNEPNSTLQRLINKLNLLDAVDQQSSSGKLDIIIQLPYTIKSESRKQQAEQRRQDIEFQLKGSQYGIAYADATEKITQLNRPAENNLLAQIEYLIKMLYGQLGITEEVMNGTADEKTMINYRNRTIEPIVEAIVEAMQRSFIGIVRAKNDERILYFTNPFALATLSELAEIGDKFTRNEILSTNDIRGFIGIPPSDDPKADELRNSNMPRVDTEPQGQTGFSPTEPPVA